MFRIEQTLLESYVDGSGSVGTDAVEPWNFCGKVQFRTMESGVMICLGPAVFHGLLRRMLARKVSSLSIASTRYSTKDGAQASWKREKSVLRRKLHVAVVGAGPAGFYAADELFKSALANVKVDMFERLPTPYGLVRNGVAPDHPEVKAVESVFHDLALSPHFNFIGNVTIGKDLSIEELQNHYDLVVLAYGAEDDKKLGIPGEHLKGVHSARYGLLFTAFYTIYACIVLVLVGLSSLRNHFFYLSTFQCSNLLL